MTDIPDREQSRPLPERYIAPSSFSRDNSEQVYQKSVEESNRRDSEWMAKLGVIAIGAQILGKQFNRNLFGELSELAGSGARFLGSLSKQGSKANIEPEIADGLYRLLSLPKDSGGAVIQTAQGSARLDSYSSIQDLGSALSFIYDPRNATNRPNLERLFKGNLDKLYRSNPEQAGLGFLQKDLTPLTFGELIARQGDFISRAAGPVKSGGLEIGIVQRALDQGLVKTDQIVDSKLFKAKDGRLIDTRITRPYDFLDTVSQTFNPFGLLSTAKSFFENPRKVASLGVESGTAAQKIFIGGDVYKSLGTNVEKIATGKTLGEVNDARFVAAKLREEPPKVREPKEGEPVPDKTWFQTLQDETGVGPKFHEKRGGFIQTVLQGIKNSGAVGRGDAEVYARNYKYTHDSFYSRILSPVIPETVLDSGKEITKGSYSGQGIIDISELTPKTGPFKGLRGWWNRFQLYTGTNEDAVLVNKGAGVEGKIDKSDLYAGFGRGGIQSLETTAGKRLPSDGPTGITITGDKDFNIRPKHYAASASNLDKAYDFTNYMMIRLNKLASASLLGIGFKPSGNLLANTLRVAAIPTAYMLGTEAVKYTDYLAGKVIGEKPSELAADAYVNLRVGQQKVRESLGITKAVDYVENDLTPGLSVGVVGTIAAGVKALGAWEKTGKVGKGLAFAASIYAAVGGPQPGQSSESLKREYSGEDKVPIKKSRWWTLGYQPFEGGAIDHYEPSWYAKLKAQPYNTNLYGSEEGYWKYGSMLPNFSNWFGLRNVVDPYALERKTYYDRPYPVTAKMFEEVPIFGPVLADTIGEIIKPTKQMHIEEQTDAVVASNIADKSIPITAAKELGISDVPKSLVPYNRPDNIRDRVDKWTNVALEPSGVWKYALGLFGIKFDQGYKMADATNMASYSRSFYDMNLGGLLGETEFLRRFILSDYGVASKINQQINPIRNTQPTWLPGSASEFEADRTYFTDFTKGDSYTKIPGGEYRLPGAGYESVNRLESGITGVYSDVDRFLILSDVAPYSSAYFAYQQKVNQMDLSPYWKSKVAQATEQRAAKENEFNFKSYTPSSQEQAARANENAFTTTVRTGWNKVTQGFLSEKPILGSKLFPFTDPYRVYVKNRVEGETYADWDNPYESIVRPAFYDVIGQDPLTATTKALAIGSIATSNFASFLSPFPALKDNPASTTAVFGLIGLAGSTARAVSTGTLEHGFVPEHVKKERETEDYFDYLKYVKDRSLQDMAEKQGNMKLAMIYSREAKRTQVYGLAQFQATGDDTRYKATLNRYDRPFYDEFVNAPADKRQKILAVVPDRMKQVLSAVWQNNAGDTGTNAQMVADQTTLDYFKEHSLPAEDWMGWNPSVPDTAIRIKAIQGGINGVSDNLHRFGYYPGQAREADLRFPGLTSPAVSITDPTAASVRLNLEAMFNTKNPFGSATKFSQRGSDQSIDWYEGHYSDQRKNNRFMFYQDALR